MKKIMFLVAACAAMVACNNKPAEKATEGADSTKVDSVVYEGTFPGADVAEMNYKLVLVEKDSTYSLATSYKMSESGTDTTELMNGKYSVMKTDSASYYKLAGENDTTVFKIVNDSTVRMVNSFDLADGGEAYNLKLKK